MMSSTTIFRVKENMKDIFLSHIFFWFSASDLFSVAERLFPRRTRRQNIFRMLSSTTIVRAKENRKDIFLSQLIFHRKYGFSQTKSSTKCFPGEVVDKDFQCERKTLKSTYCRHHDHECIYIICIPGLPISPSFSVPK